MLTVSHADKQCCKREVLSGQASHARNSCPVTLSTLACTGRGMGWEWERHSSEGCEDHWESRFINHSSGSVSLHGVAVSHYSGGQPVASTGANFEVTLPTGQERKPSY